MSKVLMKRTFEVRIGDSRWDELNDEQLEGMIDYIDDHFLKAEEYLREQVDGKDICLTVQES